MPSGKEDRLSKLNGLNYQGDIKVVPIMKGSWRVAVPLVRRKRYPKTC